MDEHSCPDMVDKVSFFTLGVKPAKLATRSIKPAGAFTAAICQTARRSLDAIKYTQVQTYSDPDGSLKKRIDMKLTVELSNSLTYLKVRTALVWHNVDESQHNELASLERRILAQG